MLERAQAAQDGSLPFLGFDGGGVRGREGFGGAIGDLFPNAQRRQRGNRNETPGSQE
jgi:hypothetical protein